jgi:hypothetical protein
MQLRRTALHRRQSRDCAWQRLKTAAQRRRQPCEQASWTPPRRLLTSNRNGNASAPSNSQGTGMVDTAGPADGASAHAGGADARKASTSNGSAKRRIISP